MPTLALASSSLPTTTVVTALTDTAGSEPKRCSICATRPSSTSSCSWRVVTNPRRLGMANGVQPELHSSTRSVTALAFATTTNHRPYKVLILLLIIVAAILAVVMRRRAHARAKSSQSTESPARRKTPAGFGRPPFLSSNTAVVEMLTLGLVVSVLIDATVIRLVVVPAAMFLLDRFVFAALEPG